MAKLPVYNAAGERTAELEAPAAIFGEEANAGLLHQVVVAELAAKRQGTAHTKTRGEVAGSGTKLWRQKGTGRARVGDRRPPHRVGGGRAKGPRTRSYRQRTAQAVKLQALRSALGTRAAGGEVVLMEPFELAEAKTRALGELIMGLGAARRVLLVLGEPNEPVVRCGRNLSGVRVAEAAQVSACDVLAVDRVIITTDALPRLEKRLS